MLPFTPSSGRRRDPSALARRLPALPLLALVLAAVASLPSSRAPAQQPESRPAAPARIADDIADFFSQVGDRIYDDCIFELSPEQVEVQQALIQAYVKHGASSSLARQLAVKQIQPPELSDKCKKIGRQAKTAPWSAVTTPVPAAKPQPIPRPGAHAPGPPIRLADKKVLPEWDCAPGVDYVTINHKGYERKLTNGEICNPFDDVVHAAPEASGSFRLGYTIKTGRLFVVGDDPQTGGRTIAWAISGRDVCRNNPDPDCLGARAVGPLPPGEYAFASDKDRRVTWGPNIKRMVAGIYLTKLWNRDRFSPAQTAAILARRNIAIHVRLKGEMSEACLGLGANAWAYVSSLIRDGRATGLSVYIDEPHPQLAEKPPVLTASSFSLFSLLRMLP
jgi:hypothetical protein